MQSTSSTTLNVYKTEFAQHFTMVWIYLILNATFKKDRNVFNLTNDSSELHKIIIIVITWLGRFKMLIHSPFEIYGEIMLELLEKLRFLNIPIFKNLFYVIISCRPLLVVIACNRRTAIDCQEKSTNILAELKDLKY